MILTNSQRWGGLALGGVFGLVGFLLSVSAGWGGAATILVVGGLIIAVVHTVLLLNARRRR